MTLSAIAIIGSFTIGIIGTRKAVKAINKPLNKLLK